MTTPHATTGEVNPRRTEQSSSTLGSSYPGISSAPPLADLSAGHQQRYQPA